MADGNTHSQSRYVKLKKDQAPLEEITPGELNQPIQVPQVLQFFKSQFSFWKSLYLFIFSCIYVFYWILLIYVVHFGRQHDVLLGFWFSVCDCWYFLALYRNLLSLFGCLEKWKGFLFGTRSKAICYLYGQALLFLAPFWCFSCQPNVERISIVMNCWLCFRVGGCKIVCL